MKMAIRNESKKDPSIDKLIRMDLNGSQQRASSIAGSVVSGNFCS